MRDSRIKDPSVIYVITQPFCCCIIYATHDLDQQVTPIFVVLLYPASNKKK